MSSKIYFGLGAVLMSISAGFLINWIYSTGRPEKTPIPESMKIAESICKEHGGVVDSSTMTRWKRDTGITTVSLYFRCEHGFQGWKTLGE